MSVTPPKPKKMPSSKLKYLALAVFTHLSWGMYHPVVRYLQKITHPPLHLVVILGAAHFFSGWLNIFVGYCGTEQEAPSLSSEQPGRMTFRKFSVGVSYGLLTLLRALTNIGSAYYTLAYYVQSVSLLTPFVVAILSSCLLGEKKRPPWFAQAFFLSSLGSFLVIAGQSLTHGDVSVHHDAGLRSLSQFGDTLSSGVSAVKDALHDATRKSSPSAPSTAITGAATGISANTGTPSADNTSSSDAFLTNSKGSLGRVDASKAMPANPTSVTKVGDSTKAGSALTAATGAAEGAISATKTADAISILDSNEPASISILETDKGNDGSSIAKKGSAIAGGGAAGAALATSDRRPINERPSDRMPINGKPIKDPINSISAIKAAVRPEAALEKPETALEKTVESGSAGSIVSTKAPLSDADRLKSKYHSVTLPGATIGIPGADKTGVLGVATTSLPIESSGSNPKTSMPADSTNSFSASNTPEHTNGSLPTTLKKDGTRNRTTGTTIAPIDRSPVGNAVAPADRLPAANTIAATTAMNTAAPIDRAPSGTTVAPTDGYPTTASAIAPADRGPVVGSNSPVRSNPPVDSNSEVTGASFYATAAPSFTPAGVGELSPPPKGPIPPTIPDEFNGHIPSQPSPDKKTKTNAASTLTNSVDTYPDSGAKNTQTVNSTPMNAMHPPLSAARHEKPSSNRGKVGFKTIEPPKKPSSHDYSSSASHGSTQAGSQPEYAVHRRFGLSDLFGVFLQCLSVMMSGCMRVCMVKTKEENISRWQLQMFQNVTNFLFCVLIAWIVDPNKWFDFFRIGFLDWALFLFFALVIFYWANVGQIDAVRYLGATLYSSLQPLRILSSVTGSYFIMTEPVNSYLSWIGIFILGVTLSGYFLRQTLEVEKKASPKKPTVIEIGGSVVGKQVYEAPQMGQSNLFNGMAVHETDGIGMGEKKSKRDGWGKLPTTEDSEPAVPWGRR